ncbi:MAG: hypothetical protein IKU07_09965 [Oscillospiraceae bacterium]|nr:hypothetical protein [Oscillospiraceae bacterium]
MKNKILTALLSFAIAVSVWLYVVTVVSPNSDKKYEDIPIVRQNEIILQDRGFMVTHIDAETIDLHLGGNRSDLNKLHVGNIIASLDLSKIHQAGTHSIPCDISYPEAKGAISVISNTPSTVMVTVEERDNQPIPVEVIYNGTVANDFVADKDNKVLTHTEVNVAGPKSVVEKIKTARITVELEGRYESINENFVYTFYDADGQPVDAQMISTDVTEIGLSLKIMRMKEIQLLVTVIDGGGATAANSEIIIEPQTIWVSGSDTLLEKLENIELGTLDLSEIAEDTEKSFAIKLPEGITDETGVTEAKVTVRFPELATKVFTFTEFTPVNVSADLDVEFMTKVLEVKVRGPKDKIEALKAEDLSITADFTNTEMGAVKIKVTVVCEDAEIGAVGAYFISANVTEK